MSYRPNWFGGNEPTGDVLSTDRVQRLIRRKRLPGSKFCFDSTGFECEADCAGSIRRVFCACKVAGSSKITLRIAVLMNISSAQILTRQTATHCTSPNYFRPASTGGSCTAKKLIPIQALCLADFGTQLAAISMVFPV